MTPLTPDQIRGFRAAFGGWTLLGIGSFIYALVLVPVLRGLLPASRFAVSAENRDYRAANVWPLGSFCFFAAGATFPARAQGPPDAAPNTAGIHPLVRDSATITCAGSIKAYRPRSVAPNMKGKPLPARLIQ
jgi:hypothetical protein